MAMQSAQDALDSARDALAKVRYQNAQARRGGTANQSSWFRISNTADQVAQVDIYDEIWTYGTNAADFRSQLRALGDSIKTIDLHINSPGGDVYDALAIMNTLRQHSAKVVTTVDGLAASSAGFIAIGASDELFVADNAEIMAHLPWAMAIGDAAEMRKTAADLDRVANNIASIFAARAGGTVADWLDVLAAETWWSAQEAVDAGLADGIAAPVAVTNHYDLSIFAHAGRASAPPPPRIAAVSTRPQPVEAEVTQQKEGTVPTLQESLAKLLGVDAAADEDTILAAAEEALTSRSDEPAPEAPEPTLEQATAVAAKAGLTVVNVDALAALQAQAKAGAEARAQQVREGHARIVDSAVSDGRIPPARRDHWLSQLEADPEGITNVIAALPAVINMTEVGHSVSNELTSEDDALYTSLYGKA